MAFNFSLLQMWQRKYRYTQSVAAGYLGISQTYFSALATGRKAPSLKTLEKICEKTGYSLNDFYISDDEALALKSKIDNEKPIRKIRAGRSMSAEEV